MAKEPPKDRAHITVPWKAEARDYTSVEGGGGEFEVPARNRKKHGDFLRRRLEQIRAEAEKREAPLAGLATELGLTLEFESQPGYPLKIGSLDRRTSGIEILSTRTQKAPTPTDPKAVKVLATVFVPFGKLDVFFRLIEQYLNEVTKEKKEPKHRPLIESIADIRLGTLSSLWTDAGRLPDLKEPGWWEVWLRVGSETDEIGGLANTFRDEAKRLKLTCSAAQVVFPERTALLIRASTKDLRDSVLLLNSMAELRLAKETAEFFTAQPVDEQRKWVDDLLARLRPAGKKSPSVCILDTGVNRGHPLLEPCVDAGDVHTYNAAWDPSDDHGHGTEMAGLALFGDLVSALESKAEIQLEHAVESVKILPPGRGKNPPQLYGEITKASIARAEIANPDRKRVVCLAVLSRDGRDGGKPSSWSSAVDQAASGAGEEGAVKRLIVVAAGNTDAGKRHLYPDSNATDGVHDPAQAWNSLTVGACTDKAILSEKHSDDWSPLAKPGELSPYSTTSLVWQPCSWPYKPDIVMEGGNVARSKNDPNYTEDKDGLSLLTTHLEPEKKLLVATFMTSAATAQAARYAAIIQAKYPAFWPETLRGLLVHSARWTPAMTDGMDPRGRDKAQVERVLRTYGYGVPDLRKAVSSASDSLTLIAQEEIQPFYKAKDGIKTKHMNLHRLPWPLEVLRGLGEEEVTMRVTLSYFVEPNPGHRNLPAKFADGAHFRYASAGLRFEVKRALEDLESFDRRVNRISRMAAPGFVPARDDGQEWLIGADARTRGSLHSDIWRGTAADLAEKGYVIVKPVRGWWSDRPHLGRWGDKLRYSLIVSIETRRQDVDILTPVENLVAIQV